MSRPTAIVKEGNEFRMNSWRNFVELRHGEVRRNPIRRSSHSGISRKFASMPTEPGQLHVLRTLQKVPNLAHLRDTPTPLTGVRCSHYVVRGPHVKGRTATGPPSRPELRASSGGA